MPARKTAPVPMPEVPGPDEIGTAPLIHDAVIGETPLIPGTSPALHPPLLALPDDSTSRLHRAPRTDPDDVTTAGDRIVKFWAKYKDGRIEPTVDTTYRDDVAIHMATVKVWKNGDSDKPDVTAHATRATNDPDPITAERAQETAETAALSRALRYLGILANPPKTS